MKDDRFSEKQVLNRLPASSLIYGFLLCSALTPFPVLAQATASGDNGPQVADIVVTAQRRTENLQNVPIAVTALTGERMAAQGINGTLALTAIAPSLQINQTSNFGSIYLRGVGSNLADPTSEPSVATYVDGVYISSPQANFFSFNNIERIEVLKGPQGTLFGRNATGGVIQVVTRDPSDAPSADVSIGYGNYDTFSQSFYGTTGITDGLAIDLAVAHDNQADGFGRNLTLNKDIFKSRNTSIRSKLLWKPAEGTEIRLIGDYSKMWHNNAYTYRAGVVSPSYPGVELYAGPYNTVANLEQLVRTKGWGAALRIDQDLGGVKLTSITSRRKSLPFFQLDSDTGPQNLGGSIYDSYVRNWSQEFQLTNREKGNFDWVAGLYYFDVVGGYDPWTSIGGQFQWRAEQTTRSWAGYGQATLRLDSGTSITAGLRYTTERQTMFSLNLSDAAIPRFSDAMTNKKLTWRLSVDQKFGEGIMGYASFNRGYKSGGFNLLDVAALNRPAPQISPKYNPEIVDAYEVGIKSDILDRRLRLNLSAFYYDYKDIQLQQPVLVGNRIQNAATATVKGFEAELEAAVTSRLTLRGAVSVLDSKYKRFNPAPAVSANGVSSIIDASGNQLVAAPKFTANFGADYRAEIGGNPLTASVSAVHNDGFYWHADNRLRQPSYTVLNGSVTLSLVDDKYQVRVWGKNLTNARYYTSEAEVAGRGDWEWRAPPRTYGITLVGHFN